MRSGAGMGEDDVGYEVSGKTGGCGRSFGVERTLLRKPANWKQVSDANFCSLYKGI